jgi:hypothetical protein
MYRRCTYVYKHKYNVYTRECKVHKQKIYYIGILIIYLMSSWSVRLYRHGLSSSTSRGFRGTRWVVVFVPRPEVRSLVAACACVCHSSIGVCV